MKSISDCLTYFKNKGHDLHLRRLLSIIRKFEMSGFLLKIGQNGDDPIYDTTYVAQTIDTNYLEYGSYDFDYFGFSLIRRTFLKSVLPIEVTKQDGSLDIGTCFVIDSHRLLTASHCIEGMANVKILDPNCQCIKPKAVWVPLDGRDIAMIELDNYNFEGVRKLGIEHGDVLEEVLSMGYPPIPTFGAINISDIAHINSEIKVSAGRIVAEDKEVYDRDPDAFLYYLINARVKGGNSGGPIINNLGFAVGMIVRISLDNTSSDQAMYDHLAYGVAITGRELSHFISKVNQKNPLVIQLPHKNSNLGFSTPINIKS